MARRKNTIAWDIPEQKDTVTNTPATTTMESEETTTTPAPSGVTTSATTENPETPTTETTPTLPIYQYVVQKQAETDAANAKATALVERYNEALTKGDSAMMALMQSAEPRRKEDEEKRLRNIAKVQAFGDILSAAARGYFAFRDKGARYVPNVPLNSPFKSIEELNRLQREYQTRKDKWDADMLSFQLGREQNKVTAAQALATQAQKDAETKDKALNDAWLKALEQEKSWRELMAREQGANNRAVYREQGANARAANHELNANNRAVYNATQKGNDAEAKNKMLMGFYDKFNPFQGEERTSTSTDARGKETTTKTKETYDQAYKRRQNEAQTHADTATAMALAEEGIPLDVVNKAIEKYKEEKGERQIPQLWPFIAPLSPQTPFEGTFEEWVTQNAQWIANQM